MNIIQEAQAQGRGLVTRSGDRVTIYTDNARGEKAIHGCIHREKWDSVTAWYMDGREDTRLTMNSDIVLYSIDEHFPWDMLPGWANHCIFLHNGSWYCGSMEPKYYAGTDANQLEHAGAYYPLPEVIIKDILLQVEEKDSIFINPKYQ